MIRSSAISTPAGPEARVLRHLRALCALLTATASQARPATAFSRQMLVFF